MTEHGVKQDDKTLESPLSELDSGTGSQSVVLINKEDLNAGMYKI